MTTMKSVHAAREQLLSDGAVSQHLQRAVRPEVLRSWRRSLMSGAAVQNSALIYNGEHRARQALRQAADPVVSRLAEQLSGLEAGLLLSDHQATVVQRWVADATIQPMMDRIHSDVGFNISEETIGTNGVGSVIETGGPIQISGPEHLAEALWPFTCVGVPVHHPITRRLEGVITMNCRAETGNPLLTPLMTSTAQEVESRLLAQATCTERQLLDEYLTALGTRRAPVAAVGEDIFIAGPRVTELLEGIDRAMLWEHVRAVALGSRADSNDYGFSTERFRIARCDPVHDAGQVIGALVEFEVPAHRTEENTPPEPTLARPTVSLPGKSAALAQTIDQATRLAAKSVPILIEGEPGVGKFALVQALLQSLKIDKGKVVVVDASVGWADGPTNFVRTLQEELEQEPDVIVLRHLESLTSEAASASASIIEALHERGRLPRIFALTSMTEQPSVGLRRLLDTVGVGRVSLAPLRDRREDIAPAAVAQLEKHRGGKTLKFSSAALRCLMRAPWPGNLRQLDATVRALASTTVGAEIRPESLPLDLQGNTRKRNLSHIEEVELSTILKALQQHDGNKAAAAQSIGISRSTLYRKLHAYHIDPDKQYF